MSKSISGSLFSNTPRVALGRDIDAYVINLSHRQDRLQQFLAMWGDSGLPIDAVTRIEAVHDSDFGGIGCTKSHLLSLTTYLAHGSSPYCAIFEDDFFFRQPVSEVNKRVSQALTEHPGLDVFLLSGCYVRATPDDQDGNRILRVLMAQTTSGYIVRRGYVHGLLDVFARSLVDMERYRSHPDRAYIYSMYAADQVWKPLQQHDEWYCTLPMLGGQCLSYSDIQKCTVNMLSVNS